MFLLHTNLTYPLTDCSSFLEDRCLKNNRLKRYYRNQHNRSHGKHPAGACCFSSNGKTDATTQTNPGHQLSDGLRTVKYGLSLNQG